MKLLEKIKIMGGIINLKKVANESKTNFHQRPLFVGMGVRSGGIIPSGHVIIAESNSENHDEILKNHFWDYGIKSVKYIVVG